MRAFTLAHPTLTGRAVQGIEIAQDVGADDGRPALLIMGMHHSREWPAGELTMEWAIDLVAGLRAGDPRIAGLLRRARVLVVPVVNPDGFVLSREVGGAFEFKRKNCRVQDLAIPTWAQCAAPGNEALGVDPNRNYGGFWGGSGASLVPTDDAYRGAGPFSEPESQNIHELVASRPVVTVVSNHTFGNLMLRPPSVRSLGEGPDARLLTGLGDAMAAAGGLTSQHAYDLYDTTGSAEDWAYWSAGAPGFTPEIGPDTGAGPPDFHPLFESIVPSAYWGTGGRGGMREAYLLALENAADPSRHSVIDGAGPAGSTIELSKTFMTATSPVLQAEGPRYRCRRSPTACARR